MAPFYGAGCIAHPTLVYVSVRTLFERGFSVSLVLSAMFSTLAFVFWLRTPLASLP